MQEDDRDIEEWARQLRSNDAATGMPAETSALRTAIAASNRAESDDAAGDRVAHARLIKRLQKEGLLGDSRAGPRKRRHHRVTDVPTHEERGLEMRSVRLGEPGLSTDVPASNGPRPRWHLWVGAMAAVLLVAIGLRLVLPPDPGTRSFLGSVTLLSAQPRATLAQAASQLESLGLQPRRVTQDGRLFLELDVSQQQLETFFKWAQPRGGRPVAQGTYRVFVESNAPPPR